MSTHTVRAMTSPTAVSSRRPQRISVAAVLLILGAHASRLAAQSTTGGSAAEDTVRALELSRAQALLSADTAALSRLVADDFVEISRFGQLRTKADNLREIATGALRLTSVKYDSLTVRIYGDVAVLMGLADNAGRFRGVPFDGKVRYTRIFVRRGTGWQAVTMQHTRLP